MDGKNLVLYNKALFRTASYKELKDAIDERGITESPSDSYYLLTLRIRVDILKECNIQPETRKVMENEIEAFTASQKKTGSKYKCTVPGCPFTCLEYSKYLKHLSFLHQNCRSRLACQYRHECHRDFASVEMLKNHYNNTHRKKVSSVAIRQNQLVEQLSSLKCLKGSCGNQLVTGIQDLKKHLYTHTQKKEEVECPFCTYQTNVTGTLKQHMSRKHPLQTIERLNTGILTVSLTPSEANVGEDPVHEDAIADESIDFDEDPVPDDGDPEMSDQELDVIAEPEDEEIFLKALSILFNSWMNIANIPWSTVNDIVAQVFDSYDKGVEYTKRSIRKKLVDDGISTQNINAILGYLDENDPFQVAKEQLQNENKRVKFIQQNFPHVKPVTVRLNSSNETPKETYQYVPIKDSLRVLLENDSYIKQCREDPYYHREGLIQDIRDGSVFRENVFFKNHPSSIPLLLFVDELEVANPLGAGKVRHKINCTYYSHINVQPQLRSKVKSVQLISLVSSLKWKKHGNLKCNERLLTDLKCLEEDGIQISKPTPMTVRAGLAYIVGDNLGQHSLAELTTNFNHGFICRWCKVTYKEACTEGKCYAGCEDDFKPEVWTKEEYDRCAELAEKDEGGDTCGVKGRCIFNCLQSFHSTSQLAACLGHDSFEGKNVISLTSGSTFATTRHVFLCMGHLNFIFFASGAI